MAFYRKKPVVIEAHEVFADYHCLEDFPISEAGKFKIGEDEQGFYVLIPTLEGDMKARVGDFIIKGVNGEFYPCKPDIFEKTYEKVAE